MRWSGELREAILLRRYKRFLADVRLDSGETLTVHCPNTGAMTGCAVPGSRVWMSPSRDPKRKTPYTWELVESPSGELICIHSALANDIVDEALREGRIAELADYTIWRRERRLAEGSRIDFLLRADSLPDCYVEVKSVTLHRGGGLGAFPDAVSQRASRHVEALMDLHRSGARVVLLFAVLHNGIRSVIAAGDVDPHYRQVLHQAISDGLEVLVMGADVTPGTMALTKKLSFQQR